MTYYVAFSGGADSTAVAILLKEQGVDFELVFADTGVELPETYWMIPRVARALGKKLHVVSGGGFFKAFMRYGLLVPGVKSRWCTRVLKQKPQDDFYNEDDTVYIGIRADEPHRLAKPTHKYNVVKSLQVAGLGKKDVFSLCYKHDLVNPCYKWRCNCSCFCCPMQRISDWLGLLEHHPSLYGLVEEWEEESFRWAAAIGKEGFTFQTGRRLKNGKRMTLRQLREQHESEQRLFCPTCGAAES